MSTVLATGNVDAAQAVESRRTYLVRPLPRKLEQGRIILEAEVGCTDRPSQILRFSVPGSYADWLTDLSDPFLIATIFDAMENGADIVVKGAVDSVLLSNLERFQDVWRCLKPDKYKSISIECEKEVNDRYRDPERIAIAAFTGGVDSAFTVHSHTSGLSGRNTRKIRAGLFVHGFDIPLSDIEAFDRAQARVRVTLEERDIELLTITSNCKDLFPDWNFTHATGIAACLALFSGKFAAGLIGSTYSYSSIGMNWGSNALTDPMLSSGSFEIVHDAGGWTRPAKLGALVDWNTAYDSLRVCWKAERKDENCGRCDKCILTLLAIDNLALPTPSSFPASLTSEVLQGMESPSQEALWAFKMIRDRQQKRPVRKHYFEALDGLVRRAESQTSVQVEKTGFMTKLSRKFQSYFSG